MGIFKRFRASMSVGIGSVEDTMVTNTQSAVYRPFSNDSVFSPGFRVIDEGSYNNYSSTTASSSQPSVKSPSKIQTTQPAMSNGQVVNAETTASRPGTSKSVSKSTKESRKSEDKRSKHKEREKSKDRKNDDKKKKDKKKIKVGEVSDEISKSKREKDKKKEKRSKDDTTTQVASVTIDEVAVASAQGQTVRTPQPSEVPTINQKPPRSRNATANPLAAQQSNSAAENSTTNPRFPSSWDQVAMHRENLHREIQARPQQNNIRSMMNQDRDSTTRFKPHTNSPRNVNNESDS